MRLAGFGSCFLQGFVYIILATIALCNFVAFAVTKKQCFLYLGVAFESRTLEMNNVHDGTWHGRGDTMCIGTYVEGVKAFELIPPSIASINSPKPSLPL
nr:hypothetical protein [Tanacetum cinerariifolium]